MKPPRYRGRDAMTPSFRDDALLALLHVAGRQEYLTTDDVWKCLPFLSTEERHEGWILSLFAEAVNDGLLVTAPPKPQDIPGYPQWVEVDISEETHKINPIEIPRVSRHCSLILWGLKNGPMTNVQLAQISLSHTRRIKDLRVAGYRISIVERDFTSGVNLYALVEVPVWRSLI